jgi:hypothetical protein
MSKQLRLISLFILLVITFSAVPGVSAHRPDVAGSGNKITIENLSTSFAFYRNLDAITPVDIYTFTAQTGEHLHTGINIPAIPGLKDFGVSVAVAGPGLPPVSQGELPASLPIGDGALIFHSKTGEDFFEPFTQTNYWGRQRIELDLPRKGTYHLVVWNPNGQAGKYVLDTGQAEVFGPSDVFRFPVWWIQVHAFFGQDFTPALFVAAGIGLISLLGLVIWRRVARTR